MYDACCLAVKDRISSNQSECKLYPSLGIYAASIGLRKGYSCAGCSQEERALLRLSTLAGETGLAQFRQRGFEFGQALN